jgi:diaminopimelate dehydrogenase
MKRLRLAVVGLGRVGQACVAAISESQDLALAGIVRRPERIRSPLPLGLAAVPVVSSASELDNLDAALVCLPAEFILEAATDLVQHHTSIVESAIFAGDSLKSHWSTMDRVALRHRVPVVVGAGWDPGLRPLFEGIFAVLCPKGSAYKHDRPGVSLHHTLAARAIGGIRDALCAELRTSDGRIQRYVYVEFLPGVDVEQVSRTIQDDPLFLDQETLVLPVDSVSRLEEQGHGVVIERWGRASGKDHQRFLLEGRFDRVAITGQIMVAAARALTVLRPGAHPLDKVPPCALWSTPSRPET